ncbi:MAG: TetR/AcrR family transcriptional regulator [Deltaproteobacteria bacterium]|nr:TetR/AcrR family transcriptional regulator [Deltaproteobacteria bacterium]
MGRPPADYSARDVILRGAAAAFGRLGYARTSVQDILQVAGVSRRTFYRVFRSKDDVFYLLFDQSVETALQLIRDAVAAADTPAAKVEAGLQAYLGAHLAIGPLARVLLLEQFPPGSTFGRRREAAVEAFIQLIEHEYRGLRRERLDPLLIRGVVAAIDYVAIQLVGESRQGAFDAERGKRVMDRILAASRADEGEPLPPLPVVSEPG